MGKNSNIYKVLISIITIFEVLVLTVQIAFIDNVKVYKLLSTIDNIIWFIFLFQYILELVLIRDKLSYLKRSCINMASIFPEKFMITLFIFIGLERALGFVNVLMISKLIRIIIYTIRFCVDVRGVIQRRLIYYSVAGTALTMISGAVGICIAEDMNFFDALWWSFVTATTVGYGDITPITLIGKSIAAVLMINSVIFVSMMTATIASYFISKDNKRVYSGNTVKYIIEKLNHFDELSESDIDEIYYVLKCLKKHSNDK